MRSQHLQRTTATVGKVASNSREGGNKVAQTTVWDGNAATAEDDGNNREGSNKGTQTIVWEASICKGRQQQ